MFYCNSVVILLFGTMHGSWDFFGDLGNFVSNFSLEMNLTHDFGVHEVGASVRTDSVTFKPKLKNCY